MKFNRGAIESAQAARDRAELVKQAEADKKKARAAIKNDEELVQEKEAARDEEQRQRRAEIERKEAMETEARKNCHVIFQATADKKIGDLTVREEQTVHACQSLGYYN